LIDKTTKDKVYKEMKEEYKTKYDIDFGSDEENQIRSWLDKQEDRIDKQAAHLFINDLLEDKILIALEKGDSILKLPNQIFLLNELHGEMSLNQ